MILIVDTYEKENSIWYDEFVSPLVRIAKRFSKVRVIHYKRVSKGLLDRASKVIISGSHLGDIGYTHNVVDRFSWVSEIEKPVLGICAGMQAIGMLFGSELVKTKEIGMVEVRVRRRNPLFEGDFSAYNLHNYAIIPSEQLRVIAESDHSVQGFKVIGRDVYGVLFHPEVRNEWVIENFLRM